MAIKVKLAWATTTAVSALLVVATPAFARDARCVIKTSDGACAGACRDAARRPKAKLALA